MTIRELYKHVLQEQECVKNRAICSHNCRQCELMRSPLDRFDALSQIAEILQAKSPDLYFANTLSDLADLIENGEGHDN